MDKQIFNIHEAKTHLSAIIARVEAGELITLARAGKPVAEINTISAAPVKNRLSGLLKDQIWVADDWNSPETNKMIEDMFYDALDDDHL